MKNDKIFDDNSTNNEEKMESSNISNNNNNNTSEITTQSENLQTTKVQTIDDFETVTNEFDENHSYFDEELNIENAIKEESETNNKSQLDANSKSTSQQLVENPSSIFNIPLISTDDKPTVDDTNKDTETNGINKDTKEDSFKKAEVDFFSFKFDTQPEPTTVNTSEHLESTPQSDNLADFGFGTVIKPKATQEIIPDQSDHIELTNFLKPKENLIKKPDEVSENDNNVIRINDDSNSNQFHNKNIIIKYSLYFFYILLGILVIVFGYSIYKNSTDFSLTRNEITLATNSTYQAEIVANSKIQDNTKYEWISDNPNIVSVDNNGLITALDSGEATITVKKSNNKKTLKVTALAIAVESITFEKSSIELKVGEETTLQPIINNDETIVIDLLWESSDSNIVTVDQNGHINAINIGSTSIFVYDEVSGLGGEIVINVKESEKEKPSVNTPNKDNDDKDDVSIPVTGIALNKSDTIMEVGEYIIVKAVVRPANATNKKISWSSSNKNVATVSSSGKITAKGTGTTTITAKTSNGKKATIKITVTKKFIKVTSISLNKEKVDLEVGEETTLSATIKPSNASNKGINWSSNDETIATVSSSGKITAKKPGTATITATTKDGNKKAVCTVTVKEKEIIAVSAIALNKSTLSLDEGSSATLTAIITPSNATYSNVSWETSNADIAEVVNGKVTAKKPGKVTITATAHNGKKAICTVTVNEVIVEATGIRLNTTQINIKVGETYQLKATISPDNTTNKTLTWITNKTGIITVENGKVTALKEGTVIVTVKTANGKRATCSVRVTNPEPEPEPTPEEPPSET